MQNPREFHTVVLAALLHDIGKFLQRGRSLAFDIEGPHPEVSARFINAFAPTFSTVADVDLLQTLVLHHHQDSIKGIPDSRQRLLACLVNKADRLSASERGEKAEDFQYYKTTPLASVFPRIFASEDLATLMNHHPSALTAPKDLSQAALFPEAFESYKTGELEAALRAFGKQADALLKGLGEAYNSLLSHLLALFAAHTWAIPASTREEVPDTSLYDHLKSTAAIAACLYQGYQVRGVWEEAATKEAPGEQFCLLVGDVSGIQRYVFDIASEERAGGGVAKRLRSRSLYVQLISEVGPLLILEEFGLPLTNVIMSSGGKFYILLPNLPDTDQRLEHFRERVDNWFLEKLNGVLGLNLAWLPFGEKEMGMGFGDVVRRLMRRLEEQKERAFLSCLTASGRWLAEAFVRPAFAPGMSACRSCGKFPAPPVPEELCSHCRQDRDWGERLRRSGYISLGLTPLPGGRELLDATVALNESPDRIAGNPSLVLQLNQSDTNEAAKFPASFRYLVNYVPTDEKGEVLDFEAIAGRSHGREYLGFLKADVDRLGEVLAFGLRGDGKDGSPRWDTISRLATLSRQLDLFFTGWVQHLLETQFQSCYAVFSGGDDLFLVGPWDHILEMAGQLQADFADYTCHNQQITLSAGIVIAPHHYPISQAAHEAEQAVKRSKAHPEKNRLTVLGHTATWAEWEAVNRQWQEMRDEDMSSAFLYALVEYGQMWQDYRRGNVLGLRFQPLLAYNVSRNLDARKAPRLHSWARQLVEWRPGDKTTESTLDKLGMLAQLLILGKGGQG